MAESAPRGGETVRPFPEALASVFDPAPFGVVATDGAGVIVYVNSRQCENSGLARADFLGRHRGTVFGPSLAKAGILEQCAALERDGTPFEITVPRFRRQSDGASVALSLRGYRHGGYNLFISSIDVALADQVSRYEQLFENASDGIFILSRQGIFVAANHEFARIVGLAREEIVGKTTEVFLPGKFKQSLERVERICREGRLGPYELEIDTPLGRKAISLNGFALIEAGVPVGVMNIARDVTEQKAAARRLERESSFLRLLKDVAVAANQAPTVEDALSAALECICDFMGWPLGHLCALDPHKRELMPTTIWHPMRAEEFESFCRASEATRLTAGVGLAGAVLADAQPRWIADVTQDPNFPRAKAAEAVGLKAALAFPVLLGREVVAVLEFFSRERLEPDTLLLDLIGNIGTQLGRVVERDRSARDLAAARDQALESAQLKSSFLASMSHEIRTPLNGVIGMAGMLVDTPLQAEQREYAETIRSCADNLLALINDILDFSKIEAGKLAIEPIPFDLEVAAQEVVELLAPKAADKGLDLVLRYAPEAPSWVIGDPGRVRQVLTNLVSNAIKFTESGHVFVNIEQESLDGGTAWIRFVVEDSGIGIPIDKQLHIFERFTQADASTTRRYGGTGLGLAISKQLVELMGGYVGLQSRPGQGSKFRFVLPLPLDMTERRPAPVIDVTSLQGTRVLIVDDDGVNRRVLHEIVTRWGMRSADVTSGADALSALRAARASGDAFQIAIVDFQMPEMNGEMLGRAIQEDPELRDTVRVLLTSCGQHGDARQMAEAGFAAYLTKPPRPAVLMSALATAWSERRHRSEAKRIGRDAAESSAPSPTARIDEGRAPTRVLVVEDNIVNQRVACVSLQRLGCRVDVAANGKEAVEMIQQMPYDLVLMDCQMPVMDGYESTRQIRRIEAEGAHIPIVAMTAHAMQGDREKCLEAGMDDHVPKPVQREALEAALKRWVQQKPPEARPALEPDLETNLRWLREEGGEDLVAELIGAFLTKAKGQVAELAALVAAGETDRVKFIAHDVKGSSATLGATTLSACARELESKVAARVDCAAEIERLAAEFSKLERVLVDPSVLGPKVTTS